MFRSFHSAGWPHSPLVQIVCLALLLVAPLRAEQQWYSVHLDGRKIGHMHATREVDGDRVRSSRTLELTLERNGERLQVRSAEQSEETADGRPLGFEASLDLAGSGSRSSGRIDAGVVTLRSEQADQPAVDQQFPWPQGALLAEGQRLALHGADRSAGAALTVAAFDPATLRAQQIRWTFGAPQSVDVHGRAERLLAARQQVGGEQAGDGVELQTWLQPDDLVIRRMRVPVLGLALDVLACDRDCALAPNQSTDVLAATLVAAPRALATTERRGPLAYRLRLDAGQLQRLDDLPGQRLHPDPAGQQRLHVDPMGSEQPPPGPADLQSTRWLQSDADEIRELARDAIGRGRTPASRMAELEARVRRHIRTKSLRVGYASALETLRQREGDCTEHALLLAALARSIGIPARIATGLAYTPTFNGRSDVFVPHAWVFAWIDGRWQGYDAALPGYGSGHLAFSVADGDPFRFYRGLELIGALRIDAVDVVAPLPATAAAAMSTDRDSTLATP